MPTNTAKKPAAKKPAKATAKRPPPKKKEPVEVQVRLRHFTVPPLPPGLSDNQRAAAILIAAGMKLPPKLVGVLPVNVEAKIRASLPMAHEMEGEPVTIKLEPREPTEEEMRQLRARLGPRTGAAGAGHDPSASPFRVPDQCAGAVAMDHHRKQSAADLLSWACAIIANAGNPLGDWASLPEEWRKAAHSWSNSYNENASRTMRGELCIPGFFTINGMKIGVAIVPDLMTPQAPTASAFKAENSTIYLQRPNHFFAPNRANFERHFMAALAGALVANSTHAYLAADPAFLQSLGSGLHQFLTTQQGDAEG